MTEKIPAIVWNQTHIVRSATSHFADRAIMLFTKWHQHQPHLDCPQWVCQGVADKEPRPRAPSCLQLSPTDLDCQILGYLHHQLQDQMGYKEDVQQYDFTFHLIFMDPCIVVWFSRNNQQDATL